MSIFREFIFRAPPSPQAQVIIQLFYPLTLLALSDGSVMFSHQANRNFLHALMGLRFSDEVLGLLHRFASKFAVIRFCV